MSGKFKGGLKFGAIAILLGIIAIIIYGIIHYFTTHPFVSGVIFGLALGAIGTIILQRIRSWQQSRWYHRK